VLPPDWPERIEQASPAELPAWIGQLEQAQAAMWARLHWPAPRPTDNHTADYTAEGLAAQLSLTKATVYRLYRAGVWPNSYKIGGKKGLRIPRADVEAWRMAKVERPRFEVISRSRTKST
jgi:excisionase family DNA binding protein